MSKKMKLSLDGLRVKSFVTSLDKKAAGNVKGGTSWPPTGATNCDTICDWTEMIACTMGCLPETEECSGRPSQCPTE